MNAKALFVLLLTWSFLPAQAQATRDLTDEGVKLYDQGKYPEAVAKYQQALAADPKDEVALTELALTYNALGKSADAVKICERLLKANPESDASVYVTYGNSLDALKKTKDAIKAYEQGLKHHPDSYSLYFNKGVSQATSDQVASIASFQQAVMLNPNHASSHMSLGVMELANQTRIPGILSLGRFLVLEPGSARSVQRLPMLDKAMALGVARTGEKAVSINISSSALTGTNGKSDGPDNFGGAELMLSMMRANALNKNTPPPANKYEEFSQQFAELCRELGELSSKQQGFTWNYYVPYFVEMEKKGFVPTFTYLVHSSQTEVPEVQQWLAAHPNEVAVFQEWSKNYLWPKPLK